MKQQLTTPCANVTALNYRSFRGFRVQRILHGTKCCAYVSTVGVSDRLAKSNAKRVREELFRITDNKRSWRNGSLTKPAAAALTALGFSIFTPADFVRA